MVQANASHIHFHFLTKPFYFPNRNQLKSFLQKLFSDAGKEVEAVNYIFCTDEYLLSLNKAHLKHNTYTDIISFELSTKYEPLLADIFISVERVKENALLYKTGFQKELLRVMFHGALHMIGYKDNTNKAIKKMRKAEEQYLALYGFT